VPNAEYFRRQADLCMRLSLLSEDRGIADLLIKKALELLFQAEEAATGKSREEFVPVGAIGGSADGAPPIPTE